MTPEDPLRARLRSLAAGAPELAAAAAVYGEVLPRVRDADLHAAPLPFSRDAAEGALSRAVQAAALPVPEVRARRARAVGLQAKSSSIFAGRLSLAHALQASASCRTAPGSAPAAAAIL